MVINGAFAVVSFSGVCCPQRDWGHCPVWPGGWGDGAGVCWLAAGARGSEWCLAYGFYVKEPVAS